MLFIIKRLHERKSCHQMDVIFHKLSRLIIFLQEVDVVDVFFLFSIGG